MEMLNFPSPKTIFNGDFQGNLFFFSVMVLLQCVFKMLLIYCLRGYLVLISTEAPFSPMTQGNEHKHESSCLKLHICE